MVKIRYDKKSLRDRFEAMVKRLGLPRLLVELAMTIPLFLTLETFATQHKPLPSVDTNSGIFVETSISTKTPYVLQPIFYKVRLYTKHNANNIIFSPLETEKLSIKANGTYHTYPTKYNGESINVIELNYIITPLRSGKVTIPATKVTGIYTKQQSSKISTPFDLDFEEERSTKNSSNSQNLALESKVTHINILPTPNHTQPWLPANSISLKDKINEGSLNIGTPITRTITIVANGLRGNQLPSLADQFSENEDYKIYSENPEISDEIEKDTIIGTRKETFIIIPQKPGKIVFPPIAIKWWDVTSAKPRKSTLPSKNLDILPNLLETSNIPVPTSPPETIAAEESQDDRMWLWWGLGFLLILLSSSGLTGRSIATKEGKMDPPVKPEDDRKVSRWLRFARHDELRSCKSAQDINEFLRNYAEEKLGLPRNSSLEMIFTATRHPDAFLQKAQDDVFVDHKHFVRKLENALYYNQDYDLAEIKKELAKILKQAKKSKIKKSKSELPGLNPR